APAICRGERRDALAGECGAALEEGACPVLPGPPLSTGRQQMAVGLYRTGSGIALHQVHGDRTLSVRAVVARRLAVVLVAFFVRAVLTGVAVGVVFVSAPGFA